MAGVSVNAASIQGGIRCCANAIKELQRVSASLENKYRQAGMSGWNDRQYKALGNIVNDCTTALNYPIDELEECTQKLKELLKAVEKYENMQF